MRLRLQVVSGEIGRVFGEAIFIVAEVPHIHHPLIDIMLSVVYKQMNSTVTERDEAALAKGIPLSISQERLWILAQLDTHSSVHTVACGLRLPGVLDRGALQSALDEVVQHHEILRTEFRTVDGVPAQFVLPPARVPLNVVDLTNFAPKEREPQLSRLAARELQNSFVTTKEQLLRVSLFELNPTEHVLLLAAHRIVCDDASVKLLLSELSSQYRARMRGEPRLVSQIDLQYRDIAAGEAAPSAPHVSYWKERLEGAPSNIDLPADRHRPTVQTFRTGRQKLSLEPALLERLLTLGRNHGTGLFEVLLAVLNVLLYRYSRQDDIVVGTRVSGRNRPELATVIGPLENLLALRVDLSGDPSFTDLLLRVDKVTKEALSHGDLAFGSVLEQLHLERDLSRHPLFQITCTLQETMIATSPGISFFEVENPADQFDLAIEFTRKESGLETAFSYSLDLFDAATIERMMGHLCILLDSAAADPEMKISHMPLLSESERSQLLVEWNDTRAEYPPIECVHDLFEAQTERTPDAIAVTYGDASLSYRELNTRANRLAHFLAGKGVRVGSLVAVYMERSTEMMVAVLAILKAGAAYVPLDPAYPQDRLAFMLSDASPAALLTQDQLRTELPGSATNVIPIDSASKEILQQPGYNPQSRANRENLVYVIYTSGSTGKPKGVCLPHRALTNLIQWQLSDSHLPLGARTLQFTSLSFDVSFQEIFATWCAGGTLVLVSESLRRDPFELLHFLRSQNIARLFLPFVALQHLAEATQGKPVPDNLREVITAGEQLRVTRQLVELFRRMPNCKLYNHYGPSETHVVTSFSLTGSPETWPALPPIGRPIANTQIYILDTWLNPLPIGVTGELYIGGVQVAHGYLNRAELTTSRFFLDPFTRDPKARLYKTGDLARMMPDKQIDYLGRIDHQVKIRGFRVELGEIENALLQHPSVSQVAVVATEDESGRKWLVAYIVPGEKQVSTPELRQFLAKSLPEYMVPARFSIVPRLPLTPSGKVDRKSLPSLPQEPQERSEIVAPRTNTEVWVAKIFQAILGLDSLGVTDDFFDLGGDSLLAGRLISRINQATGRQIPLSALFRGATVESLAQLMEQESEVGRDPLAMEIQHGKSARLAFFAIVPPGEESLGYAMLARHMGPEQTVYKIQGHAPVIAGKRPYTEQEMQTLTAGYVAAIRSVQPHGPYCLGGLCDGTHIAEQVVLALEAQGEKVALFAIFDTWVIQHSQRRWLWLVNYYLDRLRQIKNLNLKERAAVYRLVMSNKVDTLLGKKATRTDWQDAYWPKDFMPWRFRAPVVLFKRPKQPFYYISDPLLGWGKRTESGVEVHEIDFHHADILREPHVRIFGEELTRCIARVSRRTGMLASPTEDLETSGIAPSLQRAQQDA